MYSIISYLDILSLKCTFQHVIKPCKILHLFLSRTIALLYYKSMFLKIFVSTDSVKTKQPLDTLWGNRIVLPSLLKRWNKLLSWVFRIFRTKQPSPRLDRLQKQLLKGRSTCLSTLSGQNLSGSLSLLVFDVYYLVFLSRSILYTKDTYIK